MDDKKPIREGTAKETEEDKKEDEEEKGRKSWGWRGAEWEKDEEKRKTKEKIGTRKSKKAAEEG